MKEYLLKRGMPAAEIEKFSSYLAAERRKEAKPSKDGKQKSTPVTNNTDEALTSLADKFWKMGLTIDGVNVVITGIDMAMVTYHGYKNTLLRVYPETTIDMQIVRDGDDFTLAKESGDILYTHNIKDPFGDAEIIGAYVIIKNKRGEFVETLNRTDFGSMKNSSKQKYLWETWASEFWLKSVIKRACKRHFNDIVADIDKNDNEDFGLIGETAVELGEEEIEAQIQKATKNEEFQAILSKLTPQQKATITPLVSKRMKEIKDVALSTS